MKTFAFPVLSTSLAFTLLSLASASAQNTFTPGDILVSSSTYIGSGNTPVAVGQVLPVVPSGTATFNSTYYQTFNNDVPDADYGITSPITISQLTPTGGSTGVVINVPQTYLDTSFSSKSELGLTLSADGGSVTFMAYPALANQIDLSNSATPNNDFSGDPDTAPATYRAVGKLNFDGSLSPITEIVAYTGDNARNAYLAPSGFYYTVGATGGTTAALAGAQIVTPGGTPGSNSTSLGTFSFDSKPQKDNNFRGLTVFNNTLYTSKGSGSKGVDTVYQVGTAGTLPTGTGNSVTVLPGFPSTAVPASGGSHPFGLWFANATTLYVADEGTGLIADIQSPSTGLPSFNGNNSFAGLEKWSLVGGTWVLDYTLSAGLNIGTNYSVSGTSGGVSGTYTTAPDGLRNITGKVNGDGTVTVYAITSTATSQAGSTPGAGYATNNAFDEGCDPNQLVSIKDTLADTTAAQASAESFTLLQTAAYGQVLRGVSFVPLAPQGSPAITDTPTMPQWGLIGLGALLFSLAVWFLPASRFALRD